MIGQPTLQIRSKGGVDMRGHTLIRGLHLELGPSLFVSQFPVHGP